MDGAARKWNKGTEAMKRTTFAAGLIALAGVSSIGCKTTPKMAWWKSDTAAAAESTAIAHSAPALPSDLAKPSAAGATGSTTTAIAQTSGGQAAPFVPGRTTTTTVSSTPTSSATMASATAAPASYPSTSAPAFTPDMAGRIASATSAATSAAASMPTTGGNLGSIAATPYNPSMPPQPTAASLAAAAPTADTRYVAATSAPLYGTPPSGMTAGATTPIAAASAAGFLPGLPAIGGSRYGAPTPTSGATSTLASQTSGAVNNYAAPVNSTVSGAVGRYGEATTAAANLAGGAASGVQAATANVATTQPYRPGGTGTYPTTGGATPGYPEVQLATRPPTSTGGAPATGSAAPAASGSATTPGAVTTPPATTTPNRYW